MAKWFYYNEQGDKIEVTGGQLKWLAKNGKITPGTLVETEDGKKAPAKKVKGLTFPEPETQKPDNDAEKPSTIPPAESVRPKITVDVEMNFAEIFDASTKAKTATEKDDADAQVKKALLSMGGDINGTVHNGHSRLQLAVVYDDSELIVQLVKKGANVNKKSDDGMTPLHYAVGANKMKAIAALIEQGADIHATDNKKQTPLHFVCIADNAVQIIPVLLKSGADIEAKDKDGATPLHCAALKNSVSAIDALLQAGADINAEVRGLTALDIATKKNNAEAVELLCKSGTIEEKKKTAPIVAEEGINDPIQEDGTTQLHLAVAKSDIELVAQLLKRGADVNVKNNDGKTPLDCAEKIFDDCFDALLESDGNKEDCDKTDKINKICNLLREAKAKATAEGIAEGDINLPIHESGVTRLHLAAADDFNLTIQLIKRGANVNVKTNDGATPLHYAALKDNQKIVVALLEAGADVGVKNYDGLTPLDVAKKKDYRAMMDLLCKAEEKGTTAKNIKDISAPKPQSVTPASTLPKINPQTLSLDELRTRFASGQRGNDIAQRRELEEKQTALKNEISSKTNGLGCCIAIAILGFVWGIFVSVMTMAIGMEHDREFNLFVASLGYIPGIIGAVVATVFYFSKLAKEEEIAQIQKEIEKIIVANTTTNDEGRASELLSRVTSTSVSFPITQEAVRGFTNEESKAFIVRMQEYFKRRQSEFQIPSALFNAIKPLKSKRFPIYHCQLSVLFEKREWSEKSKAHHREKIPASTTVTGKNINVWDYSFSTQKEYKNTESSYMVPESICRHDCPECKCKGYSSSWTCRRCNGAGKLTCTMCNGRGVTTCSACNGRGDNICSKCNGRGEQDCSSIGCYLGFISNFSTGHNTRCPRCNGSGKESCSVCGRTGRQRCGKCNGSGVETCYGCRGRGDNTCDQCSGVGTEYCPTCNGSGSTISYINVTQNLIAQSKNDAIKVSGISHELIDTISQKIDGKRDFTEIARQVVSTDNTKDKAIATITGAFSDPSIAAQICDWLEGFKNKNERIQHFEIVLSQTIVNYVEYEIGGNQCFVWLIGKDQKPQ